MSPLPAKLSSAKDGTSTGPREVFGRDVWEDLDHGVQKETNVVDSFYELSQLRPTIISDLASWGFFSFGWESAKDNYPDNEYLEFEDYGLLSEDETHEDWLKRFLTPAFTLQVDSSSVYDISFYPFSFEMDGVLYTELTTGYEHDSLLVVRDENGSLKVFLWDSLDNPFDF